MKSRAQNGPPPGLAALVVMLALAMGPVRAGTMSSSSTAPVVNGYDIANFGNIIAGDKWFTDPVPRGQTFTTGNVPVLLKSVTYYIPVGQSAQPVKTYTVLVGKVSGKTFAQIYSDTFTQTFPWSGGEYMTWTLAAPVALEANTTYGVDVEMKSSTSSWQTGIPYISYTADAYAGGQGYGFGVLGARGDGPTLTVDKGRDRIFHLDLQDPAAPSPEPVANVPAGNSSPGGVNTPGALDELILTGWRRGPSGGRGAADETVSPLFDDRSWTLTAALEHMQLNANTTVVFRKRFQLDAARQAKMKKSRLLLSKINEKGVVYVNGWKVGESGMQSENSYFSLNGLLRVGDNVITVVVSSNANAGHMARECRIAP